MSSSAENTISARPLPVKIIAAVLLLEAVAAVGVGIYTAIVAFDEEGMHIVGTLFLAAVAFGLALFLVQAARGIWHAKPWSRGAALAWQVLQIGLAFGSFNPDNRVIWLALLLAIPAVLVLVLVLRNSVTEWLNRKAA